MSLLPIWRRREERHPVFGLQTEMNRLFEDFFGERSLVKNLWGNGDTFIPPVDVRETSDQVIVEAELPGVDPKEVQIQVEGNVLLISGERKHEKEENTKGYHRVERACGSFRRELTLPHGTNPDKVEATYKNGILTIEIPKKEEAKPKMIEVKVK